MHDQFGNALSCTSADAVRAYDRAVDAHLHAWPGVLAATSESIAAAPDFALPHALRALVLSGQGKVAEAREALSHAVDTRSGTERERSFVELADTILRGATTDALVLVVEHCRLHPTDALAASTAFGAYGLFAFSGRADHDAARLAFIETLVPHYPAEFPWLMSNHGWARIECGDVAAGLAMTVRAIERRPHNGHNAHHVMHGHYEAGQPREALAFIDGWLLQYPADALMWGHLNWHAALSQLELGQAQAAMERLTGPILAYLPRGAPFMGLADTASLLWGMRLRGMGPLPWDEVQRYAARHFPQGSNPFGELHLAMLAAARGDRDALDAAISRLGALADRRHQGAPAAIHWAQALRACLDGDFNAALAHCEACRGDGVRLGGSHAQRTIIEKTSEMLASPNRVFV